MGRSGRTPHAVEVAAGIERLATPHMLVEGDSGPVQALEPRPIFRLLALEGHEVVDVLGELNGRDALRFRMQGDVVEFDVEEAA